MVHFMFYKRRGGRGDGGDIGVQVWRSEDNLGCCWSLNPLHEAGSLVHHCASQARQHPSPLLISLWARWDYRGGVLLLTFCGFRGVELRFSPWVVRSIIILTFIFHWVTLAQSQINLHRNLFEVILPSGKKLLVNDVNFELRILKYKRGL